MRYQRIDLNLLVALDVLLAERSVTRAAERIHITQSAMSGVLARLRDHFGDPLLVPVGRTMQLTPRAQSLVEPVRDIVLRVDTTLGTQPEFDAASALRHFVIIASDYVSRIMLADVVRRISWVAPGLTFDVRPTSEVMLAELEQGRVDFVIMPAHLVASEHPKEILFEDGYRVLACLQHPDLKGNITLEQYQALGHVVYQNERGTNPWFEQWYANQHGPSRRVEVITHSFTLIPRFIVGTRRITTIQTRLANQFAQSLAVQQMDPPMETPRLTEVLQWHRLRDDDPATQWVREQIVDAAREMPAI